VIPFGLRVRAAQTEYTLRLNRPILHDMTTLLRTVHGREVRSFEELVKELGPDAVASPRRSTVPLVDYWRAPEQRLPDLWERLHVPHPGDTEMHFEYEVPVQRGRGKSSFTDLMVFTADVAVAIEAKFTEPRYESVATWLGGTPTTNMAFVVLRCACQSTDTYSRLEGRWDAGERDLGDDVSESLLAGPLLEFSQPVAIPIQPAA